MEDLSVFNLDVRVNANDADITEKARLTTVLDFLQNAAWAHYRHFEKSGGQVLSPGLGWVVSKVRLGIMRMPEWEEELTVTTWSPGFEKLYAMRNFEIKTRSGEKCAEATIAWLVINTEKKKPVRPCEYSRVWPFKKTALLRDIKGRVEKPEAADKKREFTASYSDIDVNRHVNNVKYIQWIMDAYEQGFLMKNTPVEISIDYIAEAVEGDKVAVAAREDGQATINNVINMKTGAELCRAKIVWKQL